MLLGASAIGKPCFLHAVLTARNTLQGRAGNGWQSSTGGIPSSDNGPMRKLPEATAVTTMALAPYCPTNALRNPAGA